VKKIFFIILISFSVQFLFSEDGSLETIGILGGQNVYFIHISTGLLADGFYAGIFDRDYVISMCRDMASSARRSKNSLQKLLDDRAIKEKELQSTKDMVEGYNVVIDEINALIGSAEILNEETRSQFYRYKSKAYEKIQNVLGLDE